VLHAVRVGVEEVADRVDLGSPGGTWVEDPVLLAKSGPVGAQHRLQVRRTALRQTHVHDDPLRHVTDHSSTDEQTCAGGTRRPPGGKDNRPPLPGAAGVATGWRV
jgi:hypothetical protein